MARTRAISLDIKTDALVGKDKDRFDLDFIKRDKFRRFRVY